MITSEFVCFPFSREVFDGNHSKWHFIDIYKTSIKIYYFLRLVQGRYQIKVGNINIKYHNRVYKRIAICLKIDNVMLHYMLTYQINRYISLLTNFVSNVATLEFPKPSVIYVVIRNVFMLILHVSIFPRILSIHFHAFPCAH